MMGVNWSLLILVILLSLASYRVARMIAMEDGPFDLFAILRAKIDPGQATWIGRGLNCPLCVGFWTALVMTAITWNAVSDPGLSILVWLSVAGLQAWLQRSEVSQ